MDSFFGNTTIVTNMVLIYFTYLCLTYIKLLYNKDKRKKHQDTRKRLQELRKIPMKTAEQQKEFLDLKYPKGKKFDWSIKNVSKVVLKIIIMGSFFIGMKYLWGTYIGYDFAIWQLLLIVIFVPIIINKFLKKYNLHQDDVLIYFRQ